MAKSSAEIRSAALTLMLALRDKGFSPEEGIRVVVRCLVKTVQAGVELDKYDSRSVKDICMQCIDAEFPGVIAVTPLQRAAIDAIRGGKGSN